MNFELTMSEAELLARVIEERLRDLAIEIHRTDSHKYREALERIQAQLVALGERLSSVVV